MTIIRCVAGTATSKYLRLREACLSVRLVKKSHGVNRWMCLRRTRHVLKNAPLSLGDCHCIDCRRSAGAPYVTWGSVPREDLHVTKGEPRKVVHANRIRSFAACCGTHLFFEDSNDSDTVDVTIASLDDPAPFAPQKAIWLEDKLPWVMIDKSLPIFQKSPKSSAT